MLRRAIVGAVGAWQVAGLAAVLPLLVTVAASGAPTGAILPTGGECRTLAPDAGFVAEVMTDPASGAVESRVALVIGNGAYSGTIGALPNPVNDATAVAGLLTRLGFTVLLITDATAEAIAACADRLPAAEGGHAVGLFYYSGHGIQIDDSNYLVAVDATGTEGLKGFVAVQPLVDALTERAAATLVFLDACRDNPLAADGREGLSVQTGRGLGRVEGTGGADGGPAARHARGLLVGYSTSPNAVALDGEGPYSPFTEAFLEHIGTPGLPVQQVLSEVANSVGEATDWSQTPWTRSSLTSALRLNGRQTLEEAVAASRNWANRSKEALARGLREEAIAAALKGLPPDLDDADVETFAEAHLALYTAVRSGDVRLPVEGLSTAGHEAVISPDRRRVVIIGGYSSSVSQGRPVELWDAKTGKRLATLLEYDRYSPPPTPVFSRDGRFLAVGGNRGEVLLVNAADGTVVARPPAYEPKPGTHDSFFIHSMNFDGTGDKLVVTAQAYTRPAQLHVWSIAEARMVARLDSGLFDSIVGVDVQHSDALQASFLSDGRLCASLSRDRSDGTDLTIVVAGILDPARGTFQLIGRVDNVGRGSHVDCSPDGQAVAVHGWDSDRSHLAIWTSDTPPDEPMRPDIDEVTSENLWIPSIVFSPSSKYLAIMNVSQDGVLELATGEWVPKPDAPAGYVDRTWKVFHPDSTDGASLVIDHSATRERIWAPTPTGRALVELAIGELAPARQAEVAREQVRWRAIEVVGSER